MKFLLAQMTRNVFFWRGFTSSIRNKGFVPKVTINYANNQFFPIKKLMQFLDFIDGIVWKIYWIGWHEILDDIISWFVGKFNILIYENTCYVAKP